MENRFFAAVVGLLLVGCSEDVKSVPTVEVSGTVLIGGKPVEGVEVRFVTKEFEGYGKTDSQGKYQLVAGAQVGPNKVIFSKVTGGASAMKLDPEAGIDEGQLEAAQFGQTGKGANVQRQLIPGDFTNRDNTPITFPVPEGGTDKADFKVPGK